MVYFVRHQAEGVVWRFPFLAPPSAEQQAAVLALCAATHGENHPKTKEPYWAQVVEVDVLAEGEMPIATATEPAGVSHLGLPRFEMAGVGHVQNPED